MPLDLIVFDATIADVKGAAAEGCSFCIWIVEQSVGRLLNDDDLLVANMYGDAVKFGTASVHNNDVLKHAIVKFDPYRNSESHWLGFLSGICARPLYQYILTALDEMVGPDAKTWYLNSQLNSEFSSRLIGTWFSSCKDSHQKCHKSQASFRPTRLIKIKQRQGLRVLRLCERSSIEDVVNYAALSYCWGQDQNVTTTTMTIRHHLLSINMRDLPLTIQHAILVAEVLGLCYLWVE